ncbi:hypothetical protein L1887_62856 [Cichorium endivia]|nr:hypothetical protein L1887_62856 [Cichorium endivia]
MYGPRSRSPPEASGRDRVKLAARPRGLLGSASVSSDLGALGESESATAFLRCFLVGATAAAAFASALSSVPFCFGSAADVGSAALRLDLLGADDDDAAGCSVSISFFALDAVRVEARRTGRLLLSHAPWRSPI